MKIQLIGFGNVGRNLVALIQEKESKLESLGIPLKIVSISDSKGTAQYVKGLSPEQVLKYKAAEWSHFSRYIKGCSAQDAIRNLEADVVVELTPSTVSGEPGLSHIKAALSCKKHVVAANKSPFVVAFEELTTLADRNHVRLLYEATVAAHLPVFCMAQSCFKADELVHLEGVLNATTNFIIGEMEKGKDFESSLEYAVREGWAEQNYSDDVDGLDAARKVVILANSFFQRGVKLESVKIEGIRRVDHMVEAARKSHKRVKLVCEIIRKGRQVEMSVSPRLLSTDDPLAAVNGGDMALKLTYKTAQRVFVSAQFSGVKQTVCAVLNDIVKIGSTSQAC
jgi:homoserine dehydrogenase